MRTHSKHIVWMLVFCFIFISVFYIRAAVQVQGKKSIKTVSVKMGGETVNGKTVTLQKGKNAALKVNVSPKSVKKQVTYQSSKSDVVSVNKNGTLTAKEEGTASITISVKAKGYKKKTVKVKIKVRNNENNTLVAYFSCTGTTKQVAERIADVAGADIYEIQAQESYTSDDLDYNDSSSRTTKEQSDSSARPAIAGSIENMSEYEVIYLGYPIWWSEEPRIIDTFVESYDLSGKTVIPFCTSGGSGVGTSVSNIRRLASQGTNVLEGRRFSSSVTKATIEDWINSK